MKRICISLIAGLALVWIVRGGWVLPARGEEPDAATQAKVAERLRLWKITEGFNQQHQWADAAKSGEQLLAVERELFGNSHEYVLSTIGWVAGFYEALGDFDAAVKLRREALPLAQHLYPAGDWNVTDARISLEEAEAGAKLTADERRSLQGADELYARALGDYQSRRYDEAISLAQQATAIRNKILGPQHRAHISALVLVAAALNRGANEPESELVLQQVMDLRLKLLGEDHPDTAVAIDDLAQNYAWAGSFDKALPLEQQALKIARKVHGEEHADTAQMMLNLAALYKATRDYEKATPLYRHVLEIRRKLLGDEHVDTIVALEYFAAFYRRTGDYRAAEPLAREALERRMKVSGAEHPDTIEAMNSLGMVYNSLGNYALAEPLFEEALRVRKKLLGLSDPDTALSLNNLANLYQTMAKYRAAESLYLQALEANRQTLGTEQPETVTDLNNLSTLYEAMADYGKAKSFSMQAVDISRKISGENSVETARSLHNLASIDKTLGDYSSAEALYQQAFEILKKNLGEEHAETITALNNWAGLYTAMGDFNKAEVFQRQVFEVRKKVLGERHPDTAGCLNNLAGTYQSQGDLKKAEVCYRQALAIYKEILGEEHPDTATCLSNVANVCAESGDYVAAEGFYLKSLEIRRKTLGEDHPDTSNIYGGLGMMYFAKGSYEAAEPLLLHAVEAQRKILGNKHPLTASHLCRLGALYRRLGDSAKAESLAHEGVNTLFEHLENTFAAQSERQKLLALEDLRDSLDLWLSIAQDVHVSADVMYAKLLSWKGVVFASEAGLRALRANPGTGPLFAEYQEVSGRLSTVALALPRNFDERSKRDKQLQELTDQKEAIEQKLSRLDAGFQQRRQEAHLTPATLQDLLPVDVVLVDFFEYTSIEPAVDRPGKSDKERRLIAFVVRKWQPLAEIELGPVAPIAADIERWRSCFGNWTGAADENPGLLLRRTLWEPIVAHCGDAKTVLISPDGVLSQLPFAALPGREPDTFLLQDYAFATIPVPQLLPQMLAADARHAADDVAPSLLLVGGVDYGGSPGKADESGVRRSIDPTTRSASLAGFQPLPGTLDEIKGIDDRFRQRFRAGESEVLDQARATEAAFRELAPKYRWLHVSTHGFFAPDKLKNALDRSASPSGDVSAFSRSGVAAFHPGLLSGLAMAGANSKAQPGEDDGILTALEVASLDLNHVDVAVLSACETGLGRVANGEGVLGLQRAFQISGTKTVVASLWSVPDQATMLLMQRFYANLWDGNMSRLEALREAQLWLLSHPESVMPIVTGNDSRATPKTLPPRGWAAFVLSGDWR